MGYDIGCVFKDTVLRSSLAELWSKSGSRFCVNAFHGYSHAYNCQVQNHPNSIEGAGIEDLETLERVFGGSNKLSPIVRYASAYRRLALIHAYFTQWDREKYANIGMMQFNNYKQALEIIAKQTPALDDALVDIGYTREQLKVFNDEERHFFKTLRDEDEKNLWTINYVETLQKLHKTT